MRRFPVRTLLAATLAVAVAVAALAAPAGSSETVPSADGTPDERFASALFTDFLDRPGSPAEIASTAQNVPRIGRHVVVAGFANSPEWVSALVTSYYRATLDRAPDAAGLQHWTSAIRSGMTAARAAAHFYGSREHFIGSGGTSRAWVGELYDEILGRAPDAAGLEHWARRVDGGTSRVEIAAAFHGSLESRRVRVAGLYQELLGRAPDAGGWAHWAGVLVDGHDVRLATSLASSPEYYLRATGTLPAATAPTGASRSTSSGLVHPGVLIDRTQLDLVRRQLSAGQQPWAGALERAKTSGSSSRTDRRAPQRYASLSYTPAPVAVIQAGGSSSTAYMAAHPELGLRNIGDVEHLDDARAAYTHALLSAVTGDRAHAGKAIEIMDAWSATLTEIRFDQPRRTDTGGQVYDNGKLQAGWGGTLFSRAAELVRHTGGGWSDAGVARFERVLTDVYLPLVITGWTSGANWLMTFAEATISIGVFTDDRATFDAGVRMWREKAPTTIYLPEDGPLPLPPDPRFPLDRILSLWRNPTTFVPGLQQETLRDLSHTMMGLGAMANAAETARIQGIDLYGEQRNRIVTAFELHAGFVNQYLDEAARLGTAPPSTWKPNGWPGDSFRLGGQAYTAGWEVAHSHYATRAGASMPATARLVGRLRPSGTAMHLSWETLTHAR